jgi:actin, other eukaryote
MFFTELKVDPEVSSVLMTEQPQTTKADREKMTEVVFETLKCRRFYVNVQAVLALYASGRTTGLVLDVGEGKTHAVPIFEGFPLPHAVLRSSLAGKDLTVYMKKLLMESGYRFETPTEEDQVKIIKEKLDFVALDFEEEMTNSTKTAREERYEMPDGAIVRVGNPTFRCPEALFKPAHLGLQEEVDGLHEVVFKSVNKCDSDIIFDLFGNIVLSGGTTLFRNFPARLEKEVGNLTPSAVKPRVIAPPERRRSVWIGGSLLASLPQFNSLWISAAEYQEEGTNVAYHRCFG